MVKYEKWLKTNTHLLTNQLAIVVGGTGDLGAKTVDYLLYLKAKVIIAARNLDKANKLAKQMLLKYPNAIIFVEQVDVSDLSSIDAFQLAIDKKYPKADIFINNAGIYHLPSTLSKDGYEIHFATNALGNYYLAKKIMFDLKPNAKMIFTSSIAYKFHEVNFFDVQSSNVKGKMKKYGITKRVLTYNTLALKNQLADHDISINIVHPGVSATALFSAGHSKVFRYTIFPLMKVIFHSPDKAALALIKGIFVDTQNNEWIGPQVFGGVWGYPKVSKLKKKVLNEEKQLQVQEICEDMIKKHKS